MIVSCGHDESGKYRGGKAGDQTGTEFYKRSWYKPSYGWDVVLRHPDTKVGERVAAIAAAAAANDKIGYDQNERLSFYNRLEIAGWHPENITIPCEADCSSSTAACVIAAGHQLGMDKLLKVPHTCWTGNLKAALVSAGYEALTTLKYRTSAAYLLPGDILLNEKHHVVINLDAGSKAAVVAKKETTDTVYDSGYAVGKTYTLQVNLNVREAPNGTIKQYSQLTDSGKRAALTKGGNAILKKGTRVTCNNVALDGAGNTWLKIPSGYVCAISGEKIYIK